jgi:PAS domain S-box-containing protein
MKIILDSTHSYFNVVDLKRNLIYVDPGLVKILGDYKGKKCYKYFLNTNKICPDCSIYEAMETKKKVIRDISLPGERGRCKHFVTTPFQNEKGEWLFAQVHTDITEIIKTEGKYHFLFENIPDVIVITTLDGELLENNRMIQDLSGYSEEELKQINIMQFYHNKSDYNKITGIVKKSGKIRDYECKFIRKDGRGIWVLIDANIIELYGENLILYIFRDITDRKETEEELIKYRDRLRSLAVNLSSVEEKERRKLALILHDNVGQKLAITKIRLEMLKNSRLNKNTAEHINTIYNTVEDIIQQTRDLTIQLSPPVLYHLGFIPSLDWLCDEILKKNNIDYYIENNLKEINFGSETNAFLFQAIRELLINIVKYSKAKNINISIVKRDDKIIISVIDDGVGFKIEDYKNGLYNNKKFGLFNIKERINFLGGSLNISSKLGKGTRVTLELPINLLLSEKPSI